MNLLCGVLGVIFTFKGHFDIAFYMMLAAAVCDFCDGFSARLLKAYSDLGKELDSLADLISFGVLPSLMLHRLMVVVNGESFWSYLPLVIAIFSAIRLAKFNIDERQSENFIGLATPACAMICGSFTHYVYSAPESTMYLWADCRFFIPAVSFILSMLLISEIPMFSIKFKKGMKQDTTIFRMRIAFICAIAAASIVVAVLGLKWSLIVLLSFTAYIVINIVGMLFTSQKSK